MRSPLLRSLALAALSGVLYFCGFVDVGAWPLAFVCFVPLLLALRGVESWKRALGVSWFMGLTTHLGGYYWVVHLLREFAHLPTSLSALGYVLLCIYQGASLAAAGLLAWWLARRGPLPAGLTLPIGLAASELAFPQLFPSYLANSLAWVPPAVQVVDLGGPILLSAILALTSGALYELAAAALDRRPLPWKVPSAAAALLVATLGYGAVRIGQMDSRDAAAPKLKVAIVQANVGAASKHEHAAEGIARYRRMTAEAMKLPGVGLVVWPESGLNRAVFSLDANLAPQVSDGPLTAPMIVGAVRGDRSGGKRRVWNSAFSLDERGDITGHYDKIVRLIFGEYVPGDTIFPWIYDLLPYSGHFEPGQSLEPLPVGPYRLSVNICYEDILPSLLRSLMRPTDPAGDRPHALVNVTNDSWYGPSEPPIHLALAVFRATEHRRWMVRSTATGISAFIDSSGRAVQRSGFETEELLVQDVPMITGGPTVYGLLGDWPGYLAIAYAAVELVRARRERRRATPGAPARAA